MDIKPFVDPARFAEEVEALCARITASPPAEDCDGVTLPGDRAARYRRERERTGVPIPDTTWAQIEAPAGELGVSMAVDRG